MRSVLFSGGGGFGHAAKKKTRRDMKGASALESNRQMPAETWSSSSTARNPQTTSLRTRTARATCREKTSQDHGMTNPEGPVEEEDDEEEKPKSARIARMM